MLEMYIQIEIGISLIWDIMTLTMVVVIQKNIHYTTTGCILYYLDYCKMKDGRYVCI